VLRGCVGCAKVCLTRLKFSDGSRSDAGCTAAAAMCVHLDAEQRRAKPKGRCCDGAGGRGWYGQTNGRVGVVTLPERETASPKKKEM
jgi:hypothetical protein